MRVHLPTWPGRVKLAPSRNADLAIANWPMARSWAQPRATSAAPSKAKATAAKLAQRGFRRQPLRPGLAGGVASANLRRRLRRRDGRVKKKRNRSRLKIKSI